MQGVPSNRGQINLGAQRPEHVHAEGVGQGILRLERPQDMGVLRMHEQKPEHRSLSTDLWPRPRHKQISAL